MPSVRMQTRTNDILADKTQSSFGALDDFEQIRNDWFYNGFYQVRVLQPLWLDHFSVVNPVTAAGGNCNFKTLFASYSYAFVAASSGFANPIARLIYNICWNLRPSNVDNPPHASMLDRYIQTVLLNFAELEMVRMNKHTLSADKEDNLDPQDGKSPMLLALYKQEQNEYGLKCIKNMTKALLGFYRTTSVDTITGLDATVNGCATRFCYQAGQFTVIGAAHKGIFRLYVCPRIITPPTSDSEEWQDVENESPTPARRARVRYPLGEISGNCL